MKHDDTRLATIPIEKFDEMTNDELWLMIVESAGDDDAPPRELDRTFLVPGPEEIQ